MTGRASCFLLAVAVSIGDLAEGFQFVAPSAVVRPQRGLGQQWTSISATRPFGPQNATPLMTVAQDARQAPILVTGNNVEVTEPLKEYIEKKIVKVLDKLGSTVSKVDVHLSVNKNPRVSENHNTEVTVFAKNHVIRATDSSDNMYACVDLVSDRIRRKLRRFKERAVDGRRQKQHLGEASDEAVEANAASAELKQAEEVEDPFEDKYGGLVDMSVVKKKTFPMPPISVEEAVMCLDYIDHDFYLFRNAETKDVNVVYKRSGGGVGLIEPESDK